MSNIFPFKAFFEQEISETLNDDKSRIIWDRVFSDTDELSGLKVVQKLLPFYNIKEKDKLNFSEIIEVNPSIIIKDYYANPIRFSVKSNIVEILDINNESITFNDGNNIYTIENTPKLQIKKVE